MLDNRKAYLDTIAVSELGPDILRLSDNGYDVIVGSTKHKLVLMDGFADHPRRLMKMIIKGKLVHSTAAGRYQVLQRYYDHYKRTLGLPDFGPDSQDRIALQLIRECRALADVDAGRFAAAIHKCRSRWASLPGAGYDQHEHSIEHLQAAYLNAGGTLA